MQGDHGGSSREVCQPIFSGAAVLHFRGLSSVRIPPLRLAPVRWILVGTLDFCDTTGCFADFLQSCAGLYLPVFLRMPHYAAKEWSLGCTVSWKGLAATADLCQGVRPPARRGLLLAMAGGFLATRPEKRKEENVSSPTCCAAGRSEVFHVLHCHSLAYFL